MLQTVNGETNVIIQIGKVATTTPLALFLFFLDKTKTLAQIEAELLKHHESETAREASNRMAKAMGA